MLAVNPFWSAGRFARFKAHRRPLIQNLGDCRLPSEDLYHHMRSTRPKSQPEKALALLRRSGLTRLSEFRQAGITAATISRLEAAGTITRLARGLYQLADADVDANHTLAEAVKLVPKGVICLTSALAYHGLTDQIPARVWLAIGSKDWRPRRTYPPMRFAHYSSEQLGTGITRHRIDGVSVPIFSPAKTAADMFRYRSTVGLRVAIEGLREAIRQRKATPGEIARYATEGGVWKVIEPYVAALSHD
jgi:predicted transcriptional regulator of viral defense system